jgi:glycosyltransferase involved in cell wall biosynthesis
MPKVSIIIPTYNRSGYIERCVRSCLDQTFRDLEVIVMDGASTDGSVAILQRLAESDPRLRFVSKPDDGEVFATNEGLKLACGEIYGIQASDDFYVPDAVEQAVSFLERHPHYAGVAGDALFIDVDQRLLGRGTVSYRGPMNRGEIRTIMRNRIGSPIMHGTFFGWRAIKQKVGPFDPKFSVTTDYDYYLRLLAHSYEIASLPRVQIYYTIHHDMGAIKHRQKVIQQDRQLRRRYGFTMLDEFYRTTIGRVVGYQRNQYRTPLGQKALALVNRWRGATKSSI